MAVPLRVLIAEDSEDDAMLAIRELRQGGYEPTFERVETADAMLEALDKKTWDLIITDSTMPQFSTIEALSLYKKRMLDLPFIVVSGAMSGDAGVDAMVAGASDYIAKQNLSRLVPAVHRELENARARKARRRVEQAVRDGEERFRHLAEGGREVFWFSQRVPERVLYVSPAFGDIWGIPAEELYLNPHRWIASIHPEDRPGVAAGLRLWLRGGADTYGLEYRIIGKDGAVRWIRDRRTKILDGCGKAYGASGIAEDITERKQAEEALKQSEDKYRSIFENAVEGIFQTTPEGRYLSANPALARMYGYDSPEEMIETVHDLESQQYADPEDRVRLKGLYEKHGIVERFETEILKKNGEQVWISMNARAVRNGLGEIVLYEGTAEDITSRKKAEAELKAAQERLQILSRSLLEKMEAERRLIARELHDEIGQALTAVKINLQALKRQCRDRVVASAFPETIAIIDRGLTQVRSLSLNLRPSALDDLGLAPAVRWLVQQMGRSARLNIELTADTLPRLPTEIETTCFRVIQEAITNAIRYAKAQRIVVSMRIDDDELHCSVRDDGIGFDVGWAHDEALRGRSMGLVGMQERVGLVQGSISIDSTPGGGAEIKARFPVQRRSDETF